MTHIFYLSKAEKGAINSGNEVTYFITPIEIQPHTHPLYISRMIKEQSESCGVGYDDGFYHDCIAIWSGDLDEQIEKYQSQVELYAPNRDTYISQYWDAVEQVKKLTEAKKVIDQGLTIS